MGLIGVLVGWPLAPVRALIWLGQRIQEQADRELTDPGAVRRRLEAIEEARRAGEISEEEEARAVEQVLQMMTGTRRG